MASSTHGDVSSEDRARVRSFVQHHFGLGGALRLHRHAIGWDLLKAPANVALAPIFLVIRLIALFISLVGLRRAGAWLAERRILFQSAVARAVEAAVLEELVIPRNGGSEPSLAQRRLVEDYTTIRSAVAEIFTTSLVLILGFIVFRNPTPGVISLAPLVTEHAAQNFAVNNFWLGQRLGNAWYGVFSVKLPVWYVIAVGVGLAMLASLVTTFAGIVADPIQAALGIHRRRLLRLMAKLDSQEAGAGLAGEHVLARMADLTDASVSLIRIFRP